MNEGKELFKVIVAGGRDFEDYDLLRHKLNLLLKNKLPDVEIVCGGARGADHLGRVWAIEKGLNVMYFEADWDTHGKKAGILRNCEMGDYADALIAFWDEKSRGTKHMIEYATKKNLLVRVVKYTSYIAEDGEQFTRLEETF